MVTVARASINDSAELEFLLAGVGGLARCANVAMMWR